VEISNASTIAAWLKQHPDLNCAYVFSLSPQIQTVLAELQKIVKDVTVEEFKKILVNFKAFRT
jgi:hypothetical protein